MTTLASDLTLDEARVSRFPRGIITVLNTPFDEAGRVDLDALQAHVRHAAELGVAGFLVPAMASEVDLLTAAERRAMVRAAVRACPEDCLLIGGAGAAEGSERDAVIEDLLEAGCRHVLIQMPFRGAEAFHREFARAAASGAEGLMLQDWDNVGGGLPVELIVDWFEEFETFQAIKIETLPSGPKYSEVLARTGGRLHVSGGWAVMQMIEALDRGVHAFMPTGMHEIYVAIYDRHASGDRAGAIRLFERLLPILAFANQRLEISICFFKLLLAREGIYPTERVRLPGLGFDGTSRRHAEQHATRYFALRDDLREGRI